MAQEQSDGTWQGDYLVRPGADTDDLPSVIIAGDNAPDRHHPRGWIGVRLDGAAAFFPAQEWQSQWGEVKPNEPAKP